MKSLFASMVIVNLALISVVNAGDATSIQSIDVTPQASSSGGGLMTASQLVAASKGRSAGKFSVQSNGVLYNSDHGTQCNINGGACSSTNNGLGVYSTYTLTQSGILAYEAQPGDGGSYTYVTNFYQWQ